MKIASYCWFGWGTASGAIWACLHPLVDEVSHAHFKSFGILRQRSTIY